MTTKRELQKRVRAALHEAVWDRAERMRIDVKARAHDSKSGGLYRPDEGGQWEGYFMTWPEALGLVEPGARMLVNTYDPDISGGFLRHQVVINIDADSVVTWWW